MSRLPATLLALLVVLAVGFAQQTPSPAAPEAAECATCAGVGKLEQPCPECEGDGSMPCRMCVGARATPERSLRLDLMRQRAPSAVNDVEKTKLIDAAVAEFEENRRALLELAFGTADRTKGRARCAAGCVDGKPRFFGSDRTCKACSGRGTMPCPGCTTPGSVPCSACAGRKTVVAPCPECAGSGRARDARTLERIDAASCTWCGGAEIRACTACDDDGKRDRACDPCGATGKQPCPKCRGTRKVGCAGCSATGEQTTFDASKKGGPCKLCSKRGTVPCGACKTGSIECPTCQGARRGHFDCGLCQHKAAPCAGCWDGGTRSWTTAADRLLAAGRAPLAVRFLEEAQRRVENATRRLDSRGLDDARKRDIGRALAKKQAEIGAKLEIARKQP